MARKKAGTNMTPAAGAALTAVEWEKELAAHVGESTAMAAAIGSGGVFISTRGGNFTYDGATLTQPLPVVILGSALENDYYEGDYDPDNPQMPVCYAIGTDGKALKPDPSAPQPQSETCAECQWNKFGTAERGRGKACKNVVRLALLPADSIEPADLDRAEPALMRLPVTSGKHFKGHVTRLEKVLRVPQFGAVTLLSTEDSDSNQYEVTFEIGDKLGPAAGGAVLRKRKEVEDLLFSFPDPTSRPETTTVSKKKDHAKAAVPAKKSVVAGRRKF